jgi:hypothetical protein
LVFYAKQTPLNISKLSHFELQSQQYYLGKRYSVNKKIARNREFHGIGQKHRKFVFYVMQKLHNVYPLIWWNKPIILKKAQSMEGKVVENGL